MKDSAEDYIGKKFGPKSQLEIIGYKRGRGKNKFILIYYLKCSICQEDEIFKDKIYKCTIASLNRGSIPCRCGKSYRYTEKEAYQTLQRITENSNIEFLGFCNGWRNTKSRLSLKCKIDGNKWDNTSFNSFMHHKGGCQVCKLTLHKQRETIPDEESIQQFIDTGKYAKGTIFKRLDGKMWSYTCPVCSNDDVAKAGVCEGTFIVTRHSLALGQKQCRCSKTHKWTQAEREVIINNILKNNKTVSFLGWEGEFVNSDSYVNLNCKIHGSWKISLYSFLKQRCCLMCQKEAREFGHVYILKAEGFANCFTGYGRSLNVIPRLRQHKFNLTNANYRISDVTLFKMPVQETFDIEREIKRNFELKSQDVKGFKSEATFLYEYNNLYNFIRDKLDEKEISYEVEYITKFNSH